MPDVEELVIPDISIHALREEGDQRPGGLCYRVYISIHALREEGDLLAGVAGGAEKVFLSTPSAKRATTVAAVYRTLYEFLSTPSARRATGKLRKPQ